MIKQCSLSALQFAVNNAMSLDHQIADKLKLLDEKVINIIIKPLDVSFFIKIKSGAFIFIDKYDGLADTAIHSSPIGLIRLSLLPASKMRSLFNDQVQITGDIEVGQKIKAIFDQVDIDWEGHLANFTGDVVAYQIGNIIRRGVAFKNQLTSSAKYNITDYIHEELRAFPPREEIDDFFTDIDNLALMVERIEAHINQLSMKNEKN